MFYLVRLHPWREEILNTLDMICSFGLLCYIMGGSMCTSDISPDSTDIGLLSLPMGALIAHGGSEKSKFLTAP